MNVPNLQLTVKTGSGKTLIMMPISFEASDEILGFSLRHIFMGTMRSSEGDLPAYVVVEKM